MQGAVAKAGAATAAGEHLERDVGSAGTAGGTMGELPPPDEAAVMECLQQRVERVLLEMEEDVEAVLTFDHSTDLEQLDGQDLGNALGIVGDSIIKIKKLLSPDTGSSKPVDCSKTKMPERRKAEKEFGKYSHIGQVVVDMARRGVEAPVEALPFASPVAAIIGFIYSRAAQVSDPTATFSLLAA